MQNGYRLVKFDFDGTLADSFPWFVGVVNSVADRFRFRRIEADTIKHLRGLGSREIVRHLGIPSWKLPLIARYMRRRKARDLHEVPLFAGVDDLLRRLSGAGITLAIVSSNSEQNIRRILGPANAARIHHFPCGASLVGKRASFVRVLKRSGVAPREALCVGDEIRAREPDAVFKTGGDRAVCDFESAAIANGGEPGQRMSRGPGRWSAGGCVCAPPCGARGELQEASGDGGASAARIA